MNIKSYYVMVPIRDELPRPGRLFIMVCCPICGKSETMLNGATQLPEPHGYGEGRCGGVAPWKLHPAGLVRG